MDPFFIYVSITALVILILILVLVGVSMTNLNSQDVYPPTQNACPDYWDVSLNPAFCGMPVNSTAKNIGDISKHANFSVDDGSKNNIGMCKAAGYFGCVDGGSTTYLDVQTYSTGDDYQYVKLNDNANWSTLYPGISERCAKKNWANTLNITWDGVTNYNGC